MSTNWVIDANNNGYPYTPDVAPLDQSPYPFLFTFYDPKPDIFWHFDETQNDNYPYRYGRVPLTQSPYPLVFPWYGSADTPILISNVEELNAVRTNPVAYYKQVANIDLNVAPYNTGTGWTPIPNFTGNYDGGGFTISNLYINNPTGEYLGIFGNTNTALIIKDLTVSNINITGKRYIGGICGYFSGGGTMTNCKTSGTIICDWGNSGGLIGYCENVITKCSSSVNISGLVDTTANQVGGLVGASVGNMSRCFATGTVSTGYKLGGLVGVYYGEMLECYATGVVTGTSKCGGLIGEVDTSATVTRCFTTGNIISTGNGTNIQFGGMFGRGANVIVVDSYAQGNITSTGNYCGGFMGSSQTCTLTNCYSSGIVSSTNTYVGGLIGYQENSTFTSCYYDSTTSGKSDTGKGEPKTTALMKQATTFTGWDFNTIWNNV